MTETNYVGRPTTRMADSKESNSGAVIRFTGSDPTKYKSWKKWANARLNRMVKQGMPADGRGSALMELI